MLPGECVSRGVCFQGVPCDLSHPPLTESQTPVKTLPCPNFVAGGNQHKTNFTCFQIVGENCYLLSFYPSPTFQSVFSIFVVSVEFFIPVMILIYYYGRILWIIKARIGSKMGSEDSQTAKFKLARNNVIKTLFIVVFFIFICYLGIEVLFICYNLGYKVDWNSGYYKFTVIMVFLNCTINPFIYLINYKDFQTALVRQFCCRLSRQESNLDVTSSTVVTSTGQQCEGHM